MEHPLNVLVTGAHGFVGRALCARLSSEPQRYMLKRASSREMAEPGCCHIDLSIESDWRSVLLGVDVLVHLAALVHGRDDRTAKAFVNHAQINTQGTLCLARQAAEAGVRRFVFVSTIKVLGEQTTSGHVFFAQSPADPRGAYAVSKHHAEQGLWQIARETGMEVVVIRPPLVYGAGVGANFDTLLRWLSRGLPMLVSSPPAMRSIVYIENLVDLLSTVLEHPRAANQVFLAGDEVTLPLQEVMSTLARAVNRDPLLLPIPVFLTEVLNTIWPRYRKLSASLVINIEHTKTTLGWLPPIDVTSALLRTAQHFKSDLR